MLFAEFLLLTWLGMTVIGDTAGRSAVIAAILTVVTVVGITWDKRRRLVSGATSVSRARTGSGADEMTAASGRNRFYTVDVGAPVTCWLRPS
jgi:hypothetical protein